MYRDGVRLVRLHGRALSLDERFVDPEEVILHVVAAQCEQLLRFQAELYRKPHNEVISSAELGEQAAALVDREVTLASTGFALRPQIGKRLRR
jgi:hypothetical protein